MDSENAQTIPLHHASLLRLGSLPRQFVDALCRLLSVRGGRAMKGYQLTFFTQQDRKVHHQPIAEWLMAEALRLGVHGATLLAAKEGFGHHHRMHAAHFFELADQPLEVVMVVTEEEMQRVFERLTEEHLKLVYVTVPIEFGVLGEDSELSLGGRHD
ncbi:DUF190 domain-containing protein [Pseudomonas aeruginosa]|uniref:DUF190 domain-containing protein n=1 Tax=Pseudomonas aeruginosa TaxID=287 RepID=UPI001F201CF2|nr:DUF190 domain-containing protein [Pseudomonas aeruginosa]